MSRAHHGFTLVEIVVVMVIAAVGLVVLAGLFNNNIATLVSGEDAQRAAQYAQECTERVLALRRNTGAFSTTEISSTVCDTSTLPSGFTRAVTFGASDPYTGTSTGPCPNGVLCRDITVTVSKGSVSAATTVMLAAY